jgi:hypothetical protein
MGTTIAGLVSLLIAFLSWGVEKITEQAFFPVITSALGTATATSATSGFGSVVLILDAIPIILGVSGIAVLVSPILGYTAN